MNELKIFENPEFGKIMAVEIDGKPWLVGKDVATALGYKNTKDALATHVDEEDKRILQRSEVATIENHIPKSALPFEFVNGHVPNRGLTIINESGVYSLIFSSKLDKAKAFKRWVTSEVLPAINKHGAYLTPEAQAKLTAALDGIQNLSARVEALENAFTEPSASIPSFAEPELSMLPPGGELPKQSPGKAAQRRWMRTASEKLDLLSTKFHMNNNQLLHSLYRYLENAYNEDLTELRHRVMEEQGLDECSTMKAIFFSDGLKEAFEKNIDNNLAPENRGW